MADQQARSPDTGRSPARLRQNAFPVRLARACSGLRPQCFYSWLRIGRRPVGRKFLQGQDHQFHHRLSDRGRARRLLAPDHPPYGKIYSRQSERSLRAICPAQAACIAANHLFNAAAKRRHGLRDYVADHPARGNPRRARIQVQGVAIPLDRQARDQSEHHLHHEQFAGEKHQGCVRQSRDPRRHRAQLHQCRVSPRAQQRARHQIQDRHRLRRHRRRHAGDGARRGRRAVVDL